MPPLSEEEIHRISRAFDEYSTVLDKMTQVMSALGPETTASFKKVEKAFVNVNDVARMLGGTGANQIKVYQTELKKLGELQDALSKSANRNTRENEQLNRQYIQTQVHLATVRKALTKYGDDLRELGLQNAAASVTIRNLGQVVRTGIGDENIKAWKASMANMVTPSKKVMAAMGQLAPGFKQTSVASTNAAADFKILAAGLTQAFTIGKFLLRLFVEALQGTIKTERVLLGAFALGNVSFARSAELYGRMTGAGAFWNVNQEEQIGLLNTLTSTYAVSARSQDAFTAGAAAATVKALGLGKSLNLTATQAAQTIATFRIFGVAFKALPAQIVNLKEQATAAGLTVADMSNILNELAPLSLGVSDAHTRIMSVFAQFGRVSQTSVIGPMQEFARSGRGIRASADAMNVFAKAAASLSLPEVLAFGGGMGFGGTTSLTDAFVKATTKTTRPEIMINMLRTVTKMLPRSDLPGTLAAFISTQVKGANETIAIRMADMFIATEATRTKAQKEGKDAVSDANQAQLERFTLLSSAMTDPQEKLLQIARSILAVLTGIAGSFLGGGRGVIASLLTGGPRRTP